MKAVKIFQLLMVAIFLGQMGFISFYLPQIAFSGDDFPEDIKMSFVVAGLAIGLLWLVKKLTHVPEKIPGDEPMAKEDEENTQENKGS
ncbi:MAG: hypothetical protein QNL04_07255 [SAR324 cluster bacterium]|nr:hypothetical protein [SAR324 cluster bacterium]